MKKWVYLLIAVLGNALGTALMANTFMGMTAWGSSAFNTANLFQISLGTSFIILSVFFYILAVLINRKFVFKEMVSSALFLVSFSLLADLFVSWFPSFEGYQFVYRLLINVLGMIVLLFSIALHIKVHIAVHPMDVFLHAVQMKIGVAKGTYVAYFMGFSIALIAGNLYGGIENIGIGTLLTLACSGILMRFFNDKILVYVMI